MGSSEDPEVQALHAALRRAQAASREVPVDVQIRESEAFIERAQKRVAKLDKERAEEVARMEAAQANVERLRHTQTQPPPPPDTISVIQSLQMQVEQLQTQLRCEKTRDRPGRLPEDFMPMCDEEILQWMQDRQADLHDATLSGNATEVSRLCHVIADAATAFSKTLTPPSLLANSVA